MELDNDGFPNPPPYRLIQNQQSILDEMDLVFIDPIGTGFSRASSEEENKNFLTVKKDVESVGEIIRLFISKHKRWNSPLYLAGESYGTTRAAALVDWLQNRHGIYFSGVILISCILDFQTIMEVPNHYLPQVLMFPSYALSSWYHGRVAPKWKKTSVSAFRKSVENFVINEYQPKLFLGTELSDKEKQSIAKKIAEFTGIDLSDILKWNLKINLEDYISKLFEPEKKGVGRLDSRFLGFEPKWLGADGHRDPSYFALHGPYSSCANDYLRRHLKVGKVGSDLAYEILNADVNRYWKWEVENSFLDVSIKLKSAMIQNPNLKILVLNGYYDFATPYYAALHNFRHLDLPDELRKNLSYEFYEAGHMMYIHLPSLTKLKADISKWLKGA